MDTKQKIKIMEDLSLNAWPSYQMQIYDGWILRFSYFYTHRTNCIEQLGLSSIPLQDKLDYCEDIYEKWGTPAIYKINPLLDSSFDQRLMERGYFMAHVTEVMTRSLYAYKASGKQNPNITLHTEISDQWLKGLFAMKGMTNETHLKIVPSMYAAIPKDTLAVCAWHGGRIIGTGLGILDRDYVGLYAIHVHQDFRGKGIGRAICETLLEASRQRGAAFAYLQVVQGNRPAKKLYEALGFEDFYTYWFRQQYSVARGKNIPCEGQK